FEAEDAERQEREKENAEKEAQKLAEQEVRNARIAEDAVSKVFAHTLTSYKKKDELLSIAGALQISDKGTIPELLNRIRQHMELHPELRENPRFAGLFQTPGARGRRNPATTSSSAQRPAEAFPPEASTSRIRANDLAPVMYYPPTILNYTNPYSNPYLNVPQPDSNHYNTYY
ncbi:hypothetical protein M378DRAFT_77093, partial [Amanita muscaria Koide BX008]